MLLEATDLQELQDSMLAYEIRFAEEYMVDFNPNKALKRAQVHGANKSQVNQALAAKLLEKDTVIKYIAHLHAKMGIEVGVTPKKILAELAAIAFQDARQFVTYENGQLKFRDLNNMPNTAAIKEMKVSDMQGGIGHLHELKMHDKLKGIEMLMKHYGMFTENINLTNNGENFDAPVQVVNVMINHRRPGDKLLE